MVNSVSLHHLQPSFRASITLPDYWLLILPFSSFFSWNWNLTFAPPVAIIIWWVSFDSLCLICFLLCWLAIGIGFCHFLCHSKSGTRARRAPSIGPYAVFSYFLLLSVSFVTLPGSALIAITCAHSLFVFFFLWHFKMSPQVHKMKTNLGYFLSHFIGVTQFRNQDFIVFPGKIIQLSSKWTICVLLLSLLWVPF